MTAANQEVDPAGREGRARPEATGRRAGALRVFVVENNEDTRELLCLWLERSGYVAGWADSIGAAVEQIPPFGADVLISDIGLADGTGWELLQRLEPSRPRYAVAMSGFGTATDRERSRAAGFRHHMQKPVFPGQLERILDDARRERDAA